MGILVELCGLHVAGKRALGELAGKRVGDLAVYLLLHGLARLLGQRGDGLVGGTGEVVVCG